MPDPTNIWDYNRFLYARGNPMRFNDPTGHLPLGQIEAYFGYSADEYEKMVAEWGQAVTDLLWDIPFTWGDVMKYDAGTAALMLFYQAGFAGGFWESPVTMRVDPLRKAPCALQSPRIRMN